MTPTAPSPRHDPVRPAAILLLGPTGSGKTPLGSLLEAHGLNGRPCVHFDFGEELRQAARGDGASRYLADADLAIVRRCLETGTLLDDAEFHVAETVLRVFVQRRLADGKALLVLNGLPRHVGQAAGIERLVELRFVLELACDEAAVLSRIRHNTGGDRGGRNDDQVRAIQTRLGLYARRTAPLIALYRSRGLPVRTFRVTARTTDGNLWKQMETTVP